MINSLFFTPRHSNFEEKLNFRAGLCGLPHAPSQAHAGNAKAEQSKRGQVGQTKRTGSAFKLKPSCIFGECQDTSALYIHPPSSTHTRNEGIIPMLARRVCMVSVRQLILGVSAHTQRGGAAHKNLNLPYLPLLLGKANEKRQACRNPPPLGVYIHIYIYTVIYVDVCSY